MNISMSSVLVTPTLMEPSIVRRMTLSYRPWATVEASVQIALLLRSSPGRVQIDPNSIRSLAGPTPSPQELALTYGIRTRRASVLRGVETRGDTVPPTRRFRHTPRWPCTGYRALRTPLCDGQTPVAGGDARVERGHHQDFNDLVRGDAHIQADSDGRT